MIDNGDKLINLAQNGDKDAFSELIDMHGKEIYNLCFRLTKNSEEASDVYQETFLSAYKKINKFKGRSKFLTWLYRIAINTYKSRIRTKKSKLMHDAVSLDFRQYEEYDVVTKLPQLLEDLEKKEKQKMIQQTINELGEEDKILVTLRDIEGKSYEEIGKIIKCPVGTVKSKLARARKSFKIRFTKYITEV